MRYLIADDDPLVCETVESFLLKLEDTTYCLMAGDGLTALQLLTAGGIDAVFLDLDLPGLDGPSVLKALAGDVPVVVISASADFGAASYEFRVADNIAALKMGRQIAEEVWSKAKSCLGGMA